jgi:hypothetical protein
MENKKNSYKKTVRIPIEFIEWVKVIQDEFEKVRGFRPSQMDVLKNMVSQFKGKFIV